jgi:coenzyme F420-reducing hydrogenase alpha subunit
MAAKGILPDSTPTGFPDTAKLKSDLNNIIQGMNSKKPDTVKIKQSASDILSTTATMLSDSGISNIGGNSQDPSVKQAKEMFKKMRDSMGITTKALDDMKKSAQKLSPSTP